MSHKLLHVCTVDMSLTLLLGPQLRAFQAAGYEVVTASAPGPHVATLAAWGIPHRPLLHATRAMRPREDLGLARELWRLIRREAPAIVHTHNPKPGWLGRPAAKLARVPAVVNTVHGLYALPDDPWPKRAVVYALERSAATCSDAELVQNPEDLTTLRTLRYPRGKVHLLGNGVDLARFDPDRGDPDARARLRQSWGIGPDDVVCGVVARLVWEKGYRELFEAVAALRNRVPNLRVVVAGPQDHAKGDAVAPADIVAAEELGVRFLGMRDDVEDLYAAFDLFVLPTWREGFPRAAMEAAAMGLPIVATDIRGCRQVVDDGVNGLLVPVRAPARLADAIAHVATDSQRRAAMGRASREKALKEFDDRRCIDITLAVYDDLLRRRRRR